MAGLLEPLGRLELTRQQWEANSLGLVNVTVSKAHGIRASRSMVCQTTWQWQLGRLGHTKANPSGAALCMVTWFRQILNHVKVTVSGPV
jgi:hypothetical protein